MGGEQDAWRLLTPSTALDGVKDRLNTTSTTDQLVILIKGAGHTWAEYGLFADKTTKTLPPTSIVEAQEQMVGFVKAWMREWKQH